MSVRQQVEGQDKTNAVQVSQTMVYEGALDPSVTAVNAIAGTEYYGNDVPVSGRHWIKQDDGLTTNWAEVITTANLPTLDPEYVVPPGNDGATPILITAAGGVTSTADRLQQQYIAGDGGPIIVTAVPQISPGVTVGQKLILKGTSAVDTVEFHDGDGLDLNGTPILMDDNQTIQFDWNGTVWSEDFRRA